MYKQELLSLFSTDCVAQVADIAAGKVTITPEHEALYKDLRSLPWVQVLLCESSPFQVSIDNDDTRDIDQLTAAEMLPNGNVRILISVADCDFLVAKKCELSLLFPL
jgi:exoribonuclease-2